VNQQYSHSSSSLDGALPWIALERDPEVHCKMVEIIPVARIYHLLHSPRSKKTGRARRLCRAELVELHAENVPAQRPAPTGFKRRSQQYFIFDACHNSGPGSNILTGTRSAASLLPLPLLLFSHE
jgi:hypothetical protein